MSCTLMSHALGYCECWDSVDDEPEPVARPCDDCGDPATILENGARLCGTCAAERASEAAVAARVGAFVRPGAP